MGLSGKDGMLIRAEHIAGKEHLGFVGQVREINTGVLETVTARGYIPVISPMEPGIMGRVLISTLIMQPVPLLLP